MITNMTSMTINDGAATPIGHVFSPAANGADGTSVWHDREHNQGIALGFSALKFSVRDAIKLGGPSKVRLSLSVPKLDTTSAVPVLLGYNLVNVEFSFAGVSTLQDRVDVRTMLTNALSGVSGLGDNIAHLQRPY